MSTLLIATNNKGKLQEIQALLKDLEAELVSPADRSIDLDVEETGETYAENAAIKGAAFAKAAGLHTLSDDSGLEVDALDGAPGLHSARFSPIPHATDADRRAYLLEKLKDKPRPWTARFRSVVALVQPNGEISLSEGICSGEIIPEERGQHGFGYDPIFYFPDLERTMAELTMEEKNRISHRARAILGIKPKLIAIL